MRNVLLVASLCIAAGCGKRTDPDEPPLSPPSNTGSLNIAPQYTIDLRFTVTRVELMQPIIVSAKTGSETVLDDKKLLIWLKIENISKVRKASYKRWLLPKLTDEHGNDYLCVNAVYIDNGFRLRGSTIKHTYTDLMPGEGQETDVLAFEKPVAPATVLKLEHDGHEFSIPDSAWRR